MRSSSCVSGGYAASVSSVVPADESPAPPCAQPACSSQEQRGGEGACNQCHDRAGAHRVVGHSGNSLVNTISTTAVAAIAATATARPTRNNNRLMTRLAYPQRPHL